MRPAKIKSIRMDLELTQERFAQLLGAHSITVSKWERGILKPSTWQHAIIECAHIALQKKPEQVKDLDYLLVADGIPGALYQLLKIRFQ
jgi:DNA-binding transcriptional regulator YiaG